MYYSIVQVQEAELDNNTWYHNTSWWLASIAADRGSYIERDAAIEDNECGAR